MRSFRGSHGPVGRRFSEATQTCDNLRRSVTRGRGAVKKSVRRVVFSAFLTLMRPAARMLLRCGVTWKEASELIKMALVAVASEDLGKHGLADVLASQT